MNKRTYCRRGGCQWLSGRMCIRVGCKYAQEEIAGKLPMVKWAGGARIKRLCRRG